MNYPSVLMLNSSFLPLAVVTWSKALALIWQGKAVSVHDTEVIVRSPSQEFFVPSVIQMKTSEFFSRSRVRLCKTTVLQRDDFTCQYCYKKFHPKKLNLDHVLPVSRGGKKSWTNIVTSCIPCNTRKANRTPKEAGLELFQKPEPPFWTVFDHVLSKARGRVPEEWTLFVPQLKKMREEQTFGYA